LKRNQLILSVAIVGVLTAPAIAQAHVTVQPDSVPAGGFARLDVRVPNERDDAATEEVEVQMPEGFLSVSYEPVPAGASASEPSGSISPWRRTARRSPSRSIR
jgi:uncharacterized protein YcnI